MYDYMKALLQRFETPSGQTAALEKAVKRAYKKLAGRLSTSERKMLLRLSDLEDALRDEACLDSFMCGYRLAQGIQQELAEQPPYSFEQEEEARACAQCEIERYPSKFAPQDKE